MCQFNPTLPLQQQLALRLAGTWARRPDLIPNDSVRCSCSCIYSWLYRDSSFGLFREPPSSILRPQTTVQNHTWCVRYYCTTVLYAGARGQTARGPRNKFFYIRQVCRYYLTPLRVFPHKSSNFSGSQSRRTAWRQAPRQDGCHEQFHIVLDRTCKKIAVFILYLI